MAVFTPVDGRPDREWIEPRLGEWSTMHSVVPHGYEAYVRVFHPVEARLLDWTGAEYRTLDDRTLTWREVAELTGTVAHPLMQWDRIARTLPQFRPETRGWDYREPDQGRLPVAQLSRVAGILGRSGSTECRAGLWEGNGALYPGSSSVITLTAIAGDDTAASAPEIDHGTSFATSEWEGKKLELPGRAYFLFDVDLRRLTRPDWVDDSGWGTVTSVWGDTPNLLWPLDRSWFLVSEIDFDSTVIGCSAAAAAELLADDLLDTARIPEGASLAFDADEVNR